MANTPPKLPLPSTPLQNNSFNFDGTPATPKTPKNLARSPSFLSKFSADQRRKVAEQEAIDELDNEAIRVKTNYNSELWGRDLMMYVI